MKKLTLFFFALLAVSFAFQACDNTKTYAEMLDEEKNAIKAFIKDSNIVVISQSEFYAQDSMTYDNEYVQLASGVYMHIVDKGSANLADTIKPNDLVLVRFKEYGLIEGEETLSNLSEPTVVDEFRYTVTSSSIAGLFTDGYMYMAYGSSVPAGWLVALTYVRDGAHVKLIVPSKMGHQNAQRQVYPYYYDIQKFQIWN